MIHEMSIGIDVGGSSAKIGLVTNSGEVLARRRVPSVAAGARELVDRYCAAIDELMALAGGFRLRGIGVGVPGFVTEAGLPEFTNVPMLDNYPLTEHLAGRYGVPAFIDNDANAAALAEYRYGVGRGSSRLLLVTGGTGVGVAAILGGTLVKFSGSSTGNMGHIIVDPHSEYRCAMGCRGCLETLATAPALQRRAAAVARSQPTGPLGKRLAEMGEVTVKDVKAAADAGDAAATALIQETGWWFGTGLASFAAIFLPDRILVGGGLSELGAPFHGGVKQGLANVGMPYSVQGMTVVPAQLGNDAGIVGAACLTR